MFSLGRVKPFLASVALLLAVNAGHGHSITRPPCEEDLYTRIIDPFRQQIRAWFDRYEILPHEESGMVLALREGEVKTGTRTIEVPFEIESVDILHKKVWRHGRKKYEFINVGYKGFQPDSENINRAVLNHILRYPTKDLVILFDQERAYMETVLSTHRWSIHNQVLGEYKERKQYLTQRDFEALTFINTISGNSDVFALLQYDKDSILHFNNPEIVKQRLLMTAQITYFGDRNYFKPTVRGLEMARGLFPDEATDRLPFEYRLDPDKVFAFRTRFYNRFLAFETAEIIRCASFDKHMATPDKVPKAVHDRFFLNLMETGVKRKVRNFVISVDRLTARLFREYGFQFFSELPVFNRGRPPGEDMKEYLYFLDLQSPEAQAIHAKLIKASEGVRETIEDI